ncbi:hypothetical protein SASPL_140686 [Salvia splendens]|uniref:AT-hook motif nuclear-localized protein n=1 Tax=Salvia splendens TaxID=180675 RepID=A0A8X8WP85_SALSN|nr:hypothetical protein SASPL_140686 [Salvia splendens]
MNPFDAELTRIEDTDTDGSPSVLTDAPPNKIRGRPSPRKGNRAIQGIDLTPYVLRVEIGEDIVSKIIAFTKEGSWKDETVVILSATGSISSVYIGYNGNSVIRIGQYDILSLKGSFTVSKSKVCQTEGLMVSLAETDNSVFGGSVHGMLIAATPIQVVVGSFTNAKGDGGSGGGIGRGRRRGSGMGSSSNSPYYSGGSSF